ncbi:MAG: VOC family protein [Methanobacterium sp.]
MNNPAAKTYQKSIFKQGIRAAAFSVEDIQKEFERIKKTGVIFQIDPSKVGTVTQALFDDTCGNLIQIYQV